MNSQRHRLGRGAVVALIAALVVACEREPSIAEITIGAEDFAFALPDTIVGGLVQFDLVNYGQEDHHAQFLRLNDGVSRAQFDSLFAVVMEAVPTEGDVAFLRLFEIATVAGGPAVISPGGRTDVAMELAAGEYIILCFIPSPDGVPHLAKGMTRWLTVTAPTDAAPEPPVAAGRVDMVDFAFAELPAMDSGRVVLQVTNSGAEPHEMAVLRLEGAPLEQVLQMFTEPPPSGGAPPPGPPPFRFMGGLQAIMPGQRAWVTLDLPPGDYALICFIPSPANDGQPHAALGMVRAFTIS